MKKATARSTPSLSTSRLELRPYTESYRNDFVDLNCDPAVRQHLNGPLTCDSASELFDFILASAANSESAIWAITEKGSGLYVGHTLFEREIPESEFEYTIILAQKYWGLGFGTEVTRTVMSYVFNDTGIFRIVATVDIGHVPSKRVLKKSGFSLADTKRDEHGPYFVFSLTRDSYDHQNA